MAGFDTFDEYLSHARFGALALAPDGGRLVATVAQLNEAGDAFTTALWQLDPAGVQDAVRLTHSAEGESSPAFLPDGDLLFVSSRPGVGPVQPGGGDTPAGTDAAPGPSSTDKEPSAALWALPRQGEARRVLVRAGGVQGVVVARDAGVAVLTAATLPGAGEDAERRAARTRIGTTAVLHDDSPVRFWDHDLGPEQTRLLARTSADGVDDLTPEPGRALDELEYAVSPDGSTVVTTWLDRSTPGLPRAALVVIDVATGERRTLAADPGCQFGSPAFSRDGRWIVCNRTVDCTEDEPWDHAVALIEVATGERRDLLSGLDAGASALVFGADPDTVFLVMDEAGHAPVFRLDVPTGDRTRLTASGHHQSLQVSPDGATVFALRDAWDSPPRPVRIDASARDADAVYLPAPGAVTVPGTLQRIETTAADGTTVQSWLVLPEGASEQTPAPLLLFIHGGPFSSWNAWTWRWNPWLMAARGYAVLLPDPALSTGYGRDMLRRGWGQWGGAPYTDLMSAVDAAVERPEIDETRTAALGGSYGGYMANWVAGHTERFRCIVTHASLWHMEQFNGTTDVPGDWALEWGLPGTEPERYAEFSPHRYLENIRTPMLVIHGDKDYRVPIGEALHLWWDLQRSGVESRYLYFPDEGHWILRPGNARVWYETVWAWLDHHVLGNDWVRPALV